MANTDTNGILPTENPFVVRRSDRGLSVAGTRITLYSIMDYVKENYPAKFIRDQFDLTDEQVAGVLQYIAGHRDEVEAEYQEVLRQAEATRRYWEERNREVLARIRSHPPIPGKEALRKKLLEQIARTESES